MCYEFPKESMINQNISHKDIVDLTLLKLGAGAFGAIFLGIFKEKYKIGTSIYVRYI